MAQAHAELLEGCSVIIDLVTRTYP